MNKAKELLEKLNRTTEEVEALQAYWAGTFPELGVLDPIQAGTWLQMYGLECAAEALDTTVLKINKVKQAAEYGKGEEMTALRVIKYASMCMRNAGLSAEERKALDDKKKQISAIRSAAAHKRWDKDESVSSDLHDFASRSSSLHRGSDWCSDSSTSTGRATGSGSGSGTKAASQPPVKKRKEKTNPKPTPKPKTCKSCGEELSRDVNHTCKAMAAAATPEYNDYLDEDEPMEVPCLYCGKTKILHQPCGCAKEQAAVKPRTVMISCDFCGKSKPKGFACGCAGEKNTWGVQPL